MEGPRIGPFRLFVLFHERSAPGAKRKEEERVFPKTENGPPDCYFLQHLVSTTILPPLNTVSSWLVLFNLDVRLPATKCARIDPATVDVSELRSWLLNQPPKIRPVLCGRSILVGCCNTLLQDPAAQGPLLQNERKLWIPFCRSIRARKMATIAVGYTRLLVQMKDEVPERQMLANLVGRYCNVGDT
jgi:hypothetical protein